MLPQPRRRPLWLVVVLCVFSLGAYIPIWFGLTWAEFRRETADHARTQLARGTDASSMSPLGHALSVLVPVYGVWQAYRHFALLDTLRRTADPARGVDALTGAIGTGIWWLTFTHYSTDAIFLVLDAIELAAGTAVVLYGQHALNGYWLSRPGPAVEERMTEHDRAALAIAVSFALLTLIGVLLAPS